MLPRVRDSQRTSHSPANHKETRSLQNHCPLVVVVNLAGFYWNFSSFAMKRFSVVFCPSRTPSSLSKALRATWKEHSVGKAEGTLGSVVSGVYRVAGRREVGPPDLVSHKLI